LACGHAALPEGLLATLIPDRCDLGAAGAGVLRDLTPFPLILLRKTGLHGGAAFMIGRIMGGAGIEYGRALHPAAVELCRAIREIMATRVIDNRRDRSPPHPRRDY